MFMCESSPQDTNTFSNIGCQTIELIFPKCKLEINKKFFKKKDPWVKKNPYFENSDCFIIF